MLLRHVLLEIRGFLNYVVQTYPWMNPYLKGLHLSIDGWRDDRNIGGWRFKEPSIFSGRRAHDEDWEGVGARIAPLPEEGEPEWVTPKAKLGRDLRCLMELTSTETPPRMKFRVAA